MVDNKKSIWFALRTPSRREAQLNRLMEEHQRLSEKENGDDEDRSKKAREDLVQAIMERTLGKKVNRAAPDTTARRVSNSGAPADVNALGTRPQNPISRQFQPSPQARGQSPDVFTRPGGHFNGERPPPTPTRYGRPRPPIDSITPRYGPGAPDWIPGGPHPSPVGFGGQGYNSRGQRFRSRTPQFQQGLGPRYPPPNPSYPSGPGPNAIVRYGPPPVFGPLVKQNGGNAPVVGQSGPPTMGPVLSGPLLLNNSDINPYRQMHADLFRLVQDFARCHTNDIHAAYLEAVGESTSLDAILSLYRPLGKPEAWTLLQYDMTKQEPVRCGITERLLCEFVISRVFIPSAWLGFDGAADDDLGAVVTQMQDLES
jgi:hypothetical protein